MIKNQVALPQGGAHELNGGAIAVNVQWRIPLDLDLAALCIVDGEPAELIYHANEGRRMTSPFCHLSHDGDNTARTKDRREHLVVVNPTALTRIHLFLWDHESAEQGSSLNGLALEEDVTIHLVDTSNKIIELPLVKRATPWNCVHIATIEDGIATAAQTACRIKGPNTHISSLRSLAGLAEDNEVIC